MRCKYTLRAERSEQGLTPPRFQQVDKSLQAMDDEIIYPLNVEIGAFSSFSSDQFRFELRFVYNFTECGFYKYVNAQGHDAEYYQAVDNKLKSITPAEIMSDQNELRADFEKLAAEVESLRELIESAKPKITHMFK